MRQIAQADYCQELSKRIIWWRTGNNLKTFPQIIFRLNEKVIHAESSGLWKLKSFVLFWQMNFVSHNNNLFQCTWIISMRMKKENFPTFFLSRENRELSFVHLETITLVVGDVWRAFVRITSLNVEFKLNEHSKVSSETEPQIVDSFIYGVPLQAQFTWHSLMQ